MYLCTPPRKTSTVSKSIRCSPDPKGIVIDDTDSPCMVKCLVDLTDSPMLPNSKAVKLEGPKYCFPKGVKLEGTLKHEPGNVKQELSATALPKFIKVKPEPVKPEPFKQPVKQEPEPKVKMEAAKPDLHFYRPVSVKKEPSTTSAPASNPVGPHVDSGLWVVRVAIFIIPYNTL